mgnify:CR=1 FL=1
MKFELDAQFQERIRTVFKEEGEAWLEKLPGMLKELAKHWELRLAEPISPLAYHFVCPAEGADGGAHMLKLGVPRQELLNEIHTLEAYNGQGFVRLERQEAEMGAMLLERLEPGESVLSVDGDRGQTHIFAQLLRQLPRIESDASGMPSTADWGLGLKRIRDNFPSSALPPNARLFDAAENIYMEMCESQEAVFLLHGDLHHWNMLSSMDEWKAIDPQGVIAESSFEVGAWMRNPVGRIPRDSNVKQLLNDRLAILQEQLGFDPQRMRAWAFSQCVLAACWSLEEGTESLGFFADWAEEMAEVYYPRQL